MKKLITVIIILLLFIFWVQPIDAHEGRFSISGNNLGCEGVSIWRSSWYYVIGRCAGLVYPYQEQLTKYALWAETDEVKSSIIYVDAIDDGVIDGRAKVPFTRLFITPERESVPRQPAGAEIATGVLTAFTFQGKQVVVTPVITPIPTLIPTSAPIQIPSANNIPWGLTITLIVVALIIVIGFLSFLRRG